MLTTPCMQPTSSLIWGPPSYSIKLGVFMQLAKILGNSCTSKTNNFLAKTSYLSSTTCQFLPSNHKIAPPQKAGSQSSIPSLISKAALKDLKCQAQPSKQSRPQRLTLYRASLKLSSLARPWCHSTPRLTLLCPTQRRHWLISRVVLL
jgi:hypothetical protein